MGVCTECTESTRFVYGLRGNADGAELRIEQHLGRDHLVVPVVMMMADAVIRPLGSTGPEFVPAEELAVLPAAWNGEPVVTDHPSQGTASANSPEVREAMAFGSCYNTRFENGSLQTEAWIDIDRAADLGGDAQIVVDRLLAGDTVEVSVGCWVNAEQTSGTSPSGAEYEVIWRDIMPDHLALLPVGATGACSVEMGCGTPRAARTVDGWSPPALQFNQQQRAGRRVLRLLREERDSMYPKDVLKTLTAIRAQAAEAGTGDETIRQKVKAMAEVLKTALEGMSDADLRRKLWVVLENAIPAFDWIEEVFFEDQVVVFTTWPADGPMVTWMQKYTTGTDGEISLSGEPERVEAVVRYEPVAAAGGDDPKPKQSDSETSATPPCRCSTTTPATEPEGETMNEKMKQAIGRLVACEASPYGEEHREHLATFSEGDLEALAGKFEALEAEPEPTPEPTPEPAAPAEPTPAPAAPEEETVTVSRADWEDVKAASDAHKARVARTRKALIERICEKSEAYEPADLENAEAWTEEALRKLAGALGASTPEPADPADYAAARVVGSPRAAADADDIPEPRSMRTALGHDTDKSE